jgi:hypothetical protein
MQLSHKFLKNLLEHMLPKRIVIQKTLQLGEKLGVMKHALVEMVKNINNVMERFS